MLTLWHHREVCHETEWLSDSQKCGFSHCLNSICVRSQQSGGSMAWWGRRKGLAEATHTWGYEECPPELFVTGHVSDLTCHVHQPAGHWGNSPEIQDSVCHKQATLSNDLFAMHYQIQHLRCVFMQTMHSSQTAIWEQWQQTFNLLLHSIMKKQQ